MDRENARKSEVPYNVCRLPLLVVSVSVVACKAVQSWSDRSEEVVCDSDEVDGIPEGKLNGAGDRDSPSAFFFGTTKLLSMTVVKLAFVCGIKISLASAVAIDSSNQPRVKGASSENAAMPFPPMS